jgi:hypothetical protein
MSTNDPTQNIKDDLDEYERWIDMKWCMNRYDDDDIAPIISMRDDIHQTVESFGDNISSEDIERLKDLDSKWQSWIEGHRDPNFRFNWRDFDKPKRKWWWWIDRLDELSEEDKASL